MNTDEDPFTDALVDAVARKTLPLAQAAIQLRLLRRNRIDDPDLGTTMHQLSEQAEVRREQLREMPAPDPDTRLDGLAGSEAAAAGIDRGIPDDPTTPTVDENAHGLDDAARHQGYSDTVQAVRTARRHSRPVRSGHTTSVRIGPTATRSVAASRTRAPSRRTP